MGRHAAVPHDAEASLRTELLDQVQAAHKELETQLRALRDAHPLHPDSETTKQGEAGLARLNALRDQLVGGAKGVPLAALRASITSAIADVRAYTSGMSAAVSTAQSAAAAQGFSMADYARQTADIDRRVAQSYAQENQHLANAHDIASRYGIDISGYEQERAGLESERDAARRKGDKLGERKADALIAQNTCNTMASETDSITDPAERKKHLDELRDMQRIADERRAALAAQIELEAQKTAAERHLSPEDTKSYVAQFKQEQLADFDKRKNALKTPARAEVALTELKTNIVAGASAKMPGDKTPHPMAVALTPDAHAKAQQAAARINAAHDNTAGSLDDSGFAPSTASGIKLAANSEAHKKVEVPQVPTQATGSTVSTPGH